MTSLQCDVCIVGGGMAGASVAWQLSAHRHVVLLERESHVGYHSTGRSAALYHPQYGSPVIRALTHASSAFFHAPPDGFGRILSPRGALVIGSNGTEALYARYAATAEASGQTINALTPTQTQAIVPVLRPETLAWGLYDPNAMDMDVEALLQGYLRGARGNGAEVHTGHEITAIRRDGAHWRITGPQIELSASIIVNAAGAWADTIAQLAGIQPLQLIPHRRTAFTFTLPHVSDCHSWPMVADAAEQFYFKPDAGQLLGSLCEETPLAPCDAMPEDFDVALAVDRIEQAVTFTIPRVTRSWAGLRTFGPDRNPVSGFEPTALRFYWHAGLGGYGIQTAAGISAYAAAHILKIDPPAALAAASLHTALSPARLR